MANNYSRQGPRCSFCGKEQKMVEINTEKGGIENELQTDNRNREKYGELLKKKELLEEYNNKFMNPYIAAEHGYVDEVIMPSETRQRIVSAFRMLETKKKTNPFKKHGNIPL